VNSETVLIIVIAVLIVMQLRTNWRLGWLEYRILVTSEIMAEKEDDIETAAAARIMINKGYAIYAKLTELSQ
jgi:hypothetical protein